MGNYVTYTFPKEVEIGRLEVDIDIHEDEISDMADYFGMILFKDEEELKKKAIDYIDLDALLEEKIEEAVKSPYYREKFLNILRDSGLI